MQPSALKIKSLLLLVGQDTLFCIGLASFLYLIFQNLNILSQSLIVQLQLLGMLILAVQLKLQLSHASQFLEVLIFFDPVILIEVMGLPLYFFDVLLYYFGLLDADLSYLLKMMQFFISLNQLSLQSLQFIECALKSLVLFLLAYSVLESHIRGPSDGCLCSLVIYLQRSLLKLQQSVVFKQQVNIRFLAGQFLKIHPDEFLLLIQLLPQHCNLFVLLNNQPHRILMIPLGLLIPPSIMHLPILLSHSNCITLRGYVILKAIHGEVDLFVLFFGVAGVVFSECAFEHEELVLEGSDLFVVDFSLFLREFVDLIKQQTQVVDALRNSQGDCVRVHRDLNYSCQCKQQQRQREVRIAVTIHLAILRAPSFLYCPPAFSQSQIYPSSASLFILIPYPSKQIEMQQSNRIKVFTKFSEGVRPCLTKQIMQSLNQQYYIRQFKIWEIDTSIAINLYFGIITRNKKSGGERVELGWVENELRLFVWTLVLYAYSNHIDMQDLTDDDSNYDWDLFASLFPNKPKNLFIYQAKNLLKKHNQYKKWVHEEDKLFEQLVKRDNYRLKWSDLGKYLFIESNRKYFRTPKQCRERWLNHLDPSKMKKYWMEEQDEILIEYVKQHGKKWATISKKLDNKRNEHSIKNRYKSLLTRESKLVMRPFNQEELVNSIHERFQHKNKREPDENGQMREQTHQQNHESFDDESSFNSVSIFQQKDHEPQVHDILNNISLNTVKKSQSEDSQDKNKINWSALEKQAFQFSKSNFADPLPPKQYKKQSMLHQSQMQKRVRADLFLQQDPFQMLKNYFYKGNA